MADPVRLEQRRRAARALRDAGRAHLEPLGLRRDGAGPRYWHLDRGWWRLNVWLDYTTRAIAVRPLAGIQPYWLLAEHPTLPNGAEVPPDFRGGRLDGSAGDPEEVADRVVAATAALAAELLAAWPEGNGRSLAAPDELDREQVTPHLPLRNFPDYIVGRALAGRRDECRWLLADQREALEARRREWAAEPGGLSGGAGEALLEDIADLDVLGALIDAPDLAAAVAARINQGRERLGDPPLGVEELLPGGSLPLR